MEGRTRAVRVRPSVRMEMILSSAALSTSFFLVAPSLFLVSRLSPLFLAILIGLFHYGRVSECPALKDARR